MLTIGIFPNTKKANVTTVLSWMIEYFKQRNVIIRIPENAAGQMGYPEFGQDIDLMKKEIAFALTLGGDGTLLNATRELAAAGVAVCGINLGQLGFLTEIELPELGEALERLLEGRYSIEERLMLDASVIRNEQLIPVSTALNDVVIAKGGFSRMIRLRLFVDGELTANYPADGLIIATSTGSTGYSLSAGGPIVNPNLPVILLTPICPHSLHSRSLIISEEEEVSVSFHATHSDTVLTIDGQTLFNLCPDDIVKIKRSPFRARFVKLSERSYYQTLKSKLQGD